MTAANLFLRVRDQIGDAVATYRHSDTKLLRYCNDGVRAIIARCITAAYTATGFNQTPTELAATSESVPLSDWWLDPLMHYICARVLTEDSEDSADKNLAAMHQQQFDAYTARRKAR
jgi:hypothetical protein